MRLFLCFTFAITLAEAEVKPISWADLSPSGALPIHPFNDLSIAQRDDLNLILLVRSALERLAVTGRELPERSQALVAEARQAEQGLIEAGFVVDELIKRETAYDAIIAEKGAEYVLGMHQKQITMNGLFASPSL